MTILRISLLGPLTVQVRDQSAAFRTDAERALLAYLAAHQGIPQRRDTLAALLSPDRPDQAALTYLRNRLTRLRSALGDDTATPPWFVIDRKQITLRMGDDIVIDLPQFEQRLATVAAHRHRQLAGCPTCLTRLQEAVDLVRAEFLVGLNFPSDIWESWVVAQREHVQQRALDAMARLCDARIVLGEWTAVLAVAQRQLRLEPWLEAAHRAMMQAHVQLGDRNAALAQYEQCQQLLWAELGVGPEEETSALFARIKAADDGLDSSVTRQPASRPDNLPLPAGPFFGRQTEQAQLIQRLVDPAYRLITIVGTGGIGKTRLALEVGQQLKASFPDGVWFVPLDAIKGDAAQITEQIKIAVGEAVGLGSGGLGQADKQLTGEQVLAILRDKRLLLIFDNCELLLDELAFLPTWLKRAPQIALLATSREPLNFAAESVVVLDGLPTGEADLVAAELGEAEALFAERGQMASAGFVVTAENLAQVRHICTLVDGSPLGIALAAAWVRRRSLAQISDAIDQSLDFLSTRLRDVDPRHRSMRAVFETSWQLLASEDQAVLAALSVFPTTFTAAAAAEITGATLLDLDRLCEKSLLQQQHDPERYGLHSLVRHFTADKLATRTAEVDQAFVTYFYQFARAQQDNYAAIQPEWRNLLAGISKAHARQAWQTVIDFVQVLDEPWFRQIRFHDMRTGLALALDAATVLADQSALARTRLRLGEVEMELNEYGAAEAHLGDALERFMQLEDGLGIARAQYFLGRIRFEQAQLDEAMTLWTSSKRIFEEEADRLGIARNLNMIALCHMQNANFQSAHVHLAQSVAIQHHLPASSVYIEALRYLARVKSIFGEYKAAENLLGEAANLSRAQQDMGEYAAVLFERTVLARRQKQFDAALRFGHECLDHFRQLGSLRWEALVKTQLGMLHQEKMDLPHALTLFRESLQLFAELGDLYEEAYAHCFLYKLYDKMGDTEQSLRSKQQAVRLNATLNDPELTTRLQ